MYKTATSIRIMLNAVPAVHTTTAPWTWGTLGTPGKWPARQRPFSPSRWAHPAARCSRCGRGCERSESARGWSAWTCTATPCACRSRPSLEEAGGSAALEEEGVVVVVVFPPQFFFFFFFVLICYADPQGGSGRHCMLCPRTRRKQARARWHFIKDTVNCVSCYLTWGTAQA